MLMDGMISNKPFLKMSLDCLPEYRLGNFGGEGFSFGRTGLWVDQVLRTLEYIIHLESP